MWLALARTCKLSAFLLSLYSLSLILLSPSAVITENPISVIARGGTFGAFHCAGMGNRLLWKVDGHLFHHIHNQNRGMIKATTSSSGTVQSNLTVPATAENNGTTVQCGIGSFHSSMVFSNSSTLTVLPGEFVCLNPK